jgi:hypothetical protein
LVVAEEERLLVRMIGHRTGLDIDILAVEHQNSSVEADAGVVIRASSPMAG